MSRIKLSGARTMDDNKKYSPYHGFPVTLLALIGVPLVFWLVISSAIDFYQPQFARVNPASARCIACILGSIYHFSCILGGLLRDPWHALIYRIKEFFENLPCGLPFALRCYWEDLRQDGALFIIYAAIIGTCLFFAIEGGITALSLL